MADDSPFTNRHAGEGFFVDPPGGSSGPGVLVLHSWWGLNDWTREFCRRLAGEGYSTLAPDLLGGELPSSETEGETVLAEANPDEMSGLVMSSAHTLRALTPDPNAPIAVVGFSMGASMALWLAARLGHAIGTVVSFYGAQSLDYDDSNAIFQGHYGDNDHLVPTDDQVATESFIRLGGCQTEFHVYPGAGHWFFEEGTNYDAAAAGLAWTRMTQFLDLHHRTS